EMPGKIVRIYADEGSNVKKGQTLIKLDDQLFQLELRGLNEKIADLEKDVSRYKFLAESDAIQGVKLEKTQLALSGAMIQRQSIKEKISKTTLKAPFAGVITMKLTEVGAFAGPGMPLLELGNISELEFTINVTEEDIQFFKPKNTHPLSVDSYPNLELEGEVIMIGSKGNMGNNFPVQFGLKNTTGNQVKSNMFGKVVVNIDSNAASFLIPASAIVGSNIDPQVYLVKNGKVKLKSIKTGQRFGNQMEVVGGLSSGDKIAVSGFINLFDGANVKSVNR
ncbi:MAG: efflux RND transporter periplasmic adaptor subunit, partial [Crocinitomicaceae bacterium]